MGVKVLSPSTREIMSEEEVQVAPVQEEQVAQVEVKEETKEVPQETAADRNWKEVHQVLKLQKQKIEELESRLTPQKQLEEEKDEFDDLDQGDYLTVGKARQMAEKIAEKKTISKVKEMLQQHNQQQNISHDEQRMRSKYDDYDYVIDNYAVPLIKNDPALAYKIQQSKNPAETAYKLGKISDNYEETVKQQSSPKAEKILKNSSRPTSSSAAGTPLKTQADQFTNMSKQQIWEQSQKYARGA